MSLIRKYKLWKLGIAQDSKTLEIFEFVEHTFSNLTRTYKDRGFLHKECVSFRNFKNEAILEYYDVVNFNTMNKNWLYIHHDIGYIPLFKIYKINSEEIKEFLREIIKHLYNLEIDTLATNYIE